MSLALALKVSVYELVLPAEDETQVVVARATEKRDHGTFPDTDAIPEPVRGQPKTGTIGYVHKSDRDEMSRILFGLPGESVTPEGLAVLRRYFPGDTAEALADIENLQEGLARAVALLESLQEQQQENT